MQLHATVLVSINVRKMRNLIFISHRFINNLAKNAVRLFSQITNYLRRDICVTDIVVHQNDYEVR